MRRIFGSFSALFLAATLMTLAAGAQAKAELNGLAVHSELGAEQFIAAVYSERATTDARQLLLADEHKVMELRIVEDRIFPRRFQRMWIEGMAINAGSQELEQSAEAMAQFGNLLQIKLRAGDVFRIERDPATGVTVEVNGVLLGQIKDTGLFDLLLRTWIGPVPLSSEFKASLLSGGDVNSELRMRFAGITPTEKRIQTISDAIAAISAASQPAKPASAATKDKNDIKLAAPTADSVSSDEPPKQVVTHVEKQPEPALAVIQKEAREPESTLEDEESARIVDAASVLSEQRYISKLTRRTGSFARYPDSALRRNQEGTVRLTVTLGNDGQVKEVVIVEKAKFDSLNKAAQEAVRDASPYPPIPSELALQEFQFSVPVSFRLK